MEIAFAPGDDSIYVVERPGVVRIVEQDGTVLPTPFLDLMPEARSIDGLVFHPDYASNGKFYVNTVEGELTNNIVEYQVSANPNVADEATRRVVWSRERETNAHRGGQMAFGPDGYLYIGYGDGGPPPGDPLENAQDTSNVDGAIIRLDVVDGSAPPGNPFRDGPGHDLIWTYGFRHPWRFSFDHVTGLMYVGEVGDGDLEEIDVIGPDQAGDNFGWDVMEGTSCFEAPAPGEAPCGDPSYVLPQLVYAHNDGCAVMGGYVYRGGAISNLMGQYVYGDYCLGWIRSFHYDGSTVTNQQDWTSALGSVPLLTTFGQDNDGELYLAANGVIYKIVPADDPAAVGTVAGRVFDDVDEDGLQSGEPGLPGVGVELWVDADGDGAADFEIESRQTDGTGSYSFANLDIESTYVVHFEMPRGRELTTPNVGGDDTIDSDADPTTGFTHPIVLADGELDDTVDAGLIELPFGTIGGRVWRDDNGDGIQGPGEEPYTGLWAWLYEDTDLDGAPDALVDTDRVDDSTAAYDFALEPTRTYHVLFGQQIYIDGALRLVLPNLAKWSPFRVGTDRTVDSDAIRGTGFTDPLVVEAGTLDLTIDAGIVSSALDYGELVAQDGAIAHWRLGSESGTVAVDSLGTNDGTVAGTTQWGQPGLTGGANTALRLDGTTTIEIPDSQDINLGGVREVRSVELWFQAESVSNRQLLYEEGSTARGLSVYIDDGRVWGGIWNRTAHGDGTTPWTGDAFIGTPISAGLPYHVVLVYDHSADVVEFFVNGSSVGVATGVGKWYPHGDDIGIGAVNGGTRFHTGGQSGGNRRTFTGVLDEVAVYNLALTADQVTAHFTGMAAGPAHGYADVVLDHDPIAYWRLDETFGAVAADSARSADSAVRGDTRVGRPGLISEGTAFSLDGSGDWVEVPDIRGVNLGGPWRQRTVELWFQPQAVGARQVLYEEGGTARGLSLTIENGELHGGLWQRANSPQDPAGWPADAFVSVPITAGNIYHAALVYSLPQDAVILYLNGSEADRTTGVGLWHGHGGDIAIGRIDGGTRFASGGQSGGNRRYFDGVIDEVAVYNWAIGPAGIAAHYAAR